MEKSLNSYDDLLAVAETIAEQTARACELNFYTFFKYFWSTVVSDPYIPNWHVEYLCNELQKLGELIINREPVPYDLIANVPPGTSKTTIFSIMFPAWLWTRSQSLRLITGSYSMGLSIEHSVKARNVLKSDKFQELYPNRVIFKGDQDNKALYENTNHGSRAACSVGGTVTGRHGHCVIIDDPINPEEAESEVLRERAVRWMDSTLSQRVVDRLNTPKILIMQRLHQDDPTGHLLKKMEESGKPVKLIKLPADTNFEITPRKLHLLYKQSEAEDKKLLDPKRLGDKALNNAKVDLGSRGFAGQMGQSPKAAEGNIIRLKWIKTYHELPKGNPMGRFQSWDTAFKKGEKNAWNCCGDWLEYHNGFYLDDVFCEKLDYPDLKKQVVARDAAFRPDETLVEEKATGSPLMQDLEDETTINFVKIQPEGDKEQRAHAASRTFEAGNVYIRGNASWSKLVIDQLTMFPNCSIKDIMDMVSQFIIYIKQHGTYSLDQLKGGNTSTTTEGFYND